MWWCAIDDKWVMITQRTCQRAPMSLGRRNLFLYTLYIASLLVPWKEWKKSHWKMHSSRFVTWSWIWHKIKTKCANLQIDHIDQSTLFSAADSVHPAKEESTQLQSRFPESQEPWNIENISFRSYFSLNFHLFSILIDRFWTSNMKTGLETLFAL